jgi:hypothetical protein
VGEILTSAPKMALGYVKRQIEDFSNLTTDSTPIEIIGRVGQYPKNERV